MQPLADWQIVPIWIYIVKMLTDTDSRRSVICYAQLNLSHLQIPQLCKHKHKVRSLQRSRSWKSNNICRITSFSWWQEASWRYCKGNRYTLVRPQLGNHSINTQAKIQHCLWCQQNASSICMLYSVLIVGVVELFSSVRDVGAHAML